MCPLEQEAFGRGHACKRWGDATPGTEWLTAAPSGEAAGQRFTAERKHALPAA